MLDELIEPKKELKAPPQPLGKFKEDKILEEAKKTLKKLNELQNKKIDETGYKKPNIFLKYYLIPLLVGVFNIAGVILLFMFKESLGFLFMVVVTFYVGLALPLQLGVVCYTFIRLFMDKNKITNKIKTVMPINFIVANFFLPQRKVLKRVCQINNDGISFSIGDARYIIDSEKIFFDDERFPNGYWLPHLPNQLGFDFSKELIRISTVMRNPDFETKDLIDSKGNMVDVIYSSKNLETFRKDKVFKEFHQQTTPETMKLVFALAGIIGVMVVLGFILVIILR